MPDFPADLRERPAPFCAETVADLWTDPHVSARMLACHLDPDSPLASRPHGAIERVVGWLDARFHFAGKCVLDLGCGPGLYAERMARRGARVVGIDFSERSIAHARAAAAEAGLDIDYRAADYLRAALPGGQDLALLIYGDFGALSPARRGGLLARVRAALKPGGAFVFDVFSRPQFELRAESTESAANLMDGFWAAGDYVGHRASFLYDELSLALDRYRIEQAGRTREIFNWLQYFTPEGVAAELSAAGFAVEAAVEAVDGGPWTPGPSEFAVVARAGREFRRRRRAAARPARAGSPTPPPPSARAWPPAPATGLR